MGALGQILGATASGIFGMNAQKKQHEYNLDETEKGLALQYGYNERGAQQADARQRKLYEDYMTYKAQVKQMKEAGLNPAMMYEMNGGGGGGSHMPSQGTAASVSGMIGGTGLPTLPMTDIGLAQAQTNLLKAQAGKASAEAASINGEKGTVGAAQIESMKADASLKIAQEAGVQIENSTKKPLNDAQIKLLQTQADTLMQNVQNEIMKINLSYKQFRHEQQRLNESKRQFDLSRKDTNFKWANEFMEQRKQFNKSIDQSLKIFEAGIENTINENRKKRRQEIINGIMHTAGSITEGLILGTMFKGGGTTLKMGTIMPNFGKYAETTNIYGRDWL